MFNDVYGVVNLLLTSFHIIPKKIAHRRSKRGTVTTFPRTRRKRRMCNDHLFSARFSASRMT